MTRLYISTITANLTPEYRALPKPHPGAVAYAPEGAGVRVKPLVWSSEPWLQDNNSDASALSSFGRYYVQNGAYYWGPGVIISTGYAHIAAAKAAAQADYEARIMAALEPMEPSDDQR